MGVVPVSDDYDLAIIGAGPAGLTAAIYATRALLRVVVIEAMLPGGQVNLAERIENYPGFEAGINGGDLSEAMAAQARRLGVSLVTATVSRVRLADGIFLAESDGARLTARAVIVASGTRPRRLGIDGEERLTGHGVSYCATCDGPFFKGEEVAVVGGGDTAVKEALFLTRFCSRLHLVHRRGELRAEKVLQQRLFADPKVSPVLNHVPLEVLGDREVTGLRVREVTTGAVRDLAVKGVFPLIGAEPRTGMVADLVELDPHGAIDTDEANATRTPGMWAAGDVRAGNVRQIVTAAGDGARAALAAIHWLAECGVK